MPDYKQIALTDTLEASINSIMSRFDGNWLITGNRTDEYEPGNRDNKDNNKYTMRYHADYHGFTEICICVEGIFAMEIESSIFEIKKGDVCIILPGLMHSELSGKEADYMALWFGFNSRKIAIHLSGIRERNFFTAAVQSLRTGYEYEYILNNIKQEKESGNICSTGMVKSYLLHFLIITLRKIKADSEGKSDSNAWKMAIVKEIQEFIEKHGLKHLRLSDISQKLCISAGHVNNLFKAVTGSTIMQYVEDCRINKAKLLLENSTESINSISDQLGYYDQYHFSKVFKKAVGCSPSQFRKNRAGY